VADPRRWRATALGKRSLGGSVAGLPALWGADL